MRTLRIALLLLAPLSLHAQRGAPPPIMTLQQALNEQLHLPLPRTHTPEPTVAAITSNDLMTRLYIFADDSMMGRDAGTLGSKKATDYLAAEMKKLGLKPGGENGTYFQDYPNVRRALDSTSTIVVGTTTLKAGVDFIASNRGRPVTLGNVGVIYVGTQGDTVNPITAAQVKGKIAIVAGGGGGGGRGGAFAGGGGRGGRGGGGAPATPEQARADSLRAQVTAAMAQVAAVATVIDSFSANQLRTLFDSTRAAVIQPGAPDAAKTPITLTLTRKAAAVLLGASPDSAKKGLVGKNARANIRFLDNQQSTRNVIAILPGSDSKLKNEYVAIGAHSDHVGVANRAQDHDEVRLTNAMLRVQGAEGRGGAATPDLSAQIKAALDSIHKVRGVWMDSISNGADDDGSGSVTVLELAEAFAKGPIKPKRSIIFVWHVGEEKGLWGSDYFTQHPTVPRESIVAQLNMDMVGRGGANDIPGGAPNYVEPVGWKRISSDLGAIAEAVNTRQKVPFSFDLMYDAPGQANNIYCRSDHANYARYGIPIVYFTTGLHRDYHQVSDEPQYIDYTHMAAVGQYMFDLAVAVGDAPTRPKVDGNVPINPLQPCRNNGVVPDSLAKGKGKGGR